MYRELYISNFSRFNFNSEGFRITIQNRSDDERA